VNLRETFIWNVLIGVGAVTIFYFIYLDYNNYQKYNKRWKEYSNEELGTDKELSNKIIALETKLKDKEEYIFKFKNNPTDLRRIIEIEGMESYFGISSDDIKVYGKVGKRAIIQYKGRTYKVSIGDTIAGGQVTVLNNKELVFVKDDEEKHYSLTRTK
tara:strand:- start:319 stop:792 length:474 start_codon:yes stop_codon:yes gene_type:complete